LGEECCGDIITSSQTFLSQCKSSFSMGILKIFTEISFMDIIAFNPRAHKTSFLPFILRCVHHFTFAFDL